MAKTNPSEIGRWADNARIFAREMGRSCRDNTRIYLGKLRSLFSSVWHGSVHWGWFAVLLVGAFSMASIGEFGGALFAVILSIFSLGSKYWHWAKGRGGVWARTSFGVVLFVLSGTILSCFWINDMRRTESWSHLPKAWNAMLIASTWDLETLPNLAYPNPPAAPVDHEPSHVAVLPKPKQLLIPSLDIIYNAAGPSFNFINRGVSNIYLWTAFVGPNPIIEPRDVEKFVTITPNGGAYHIWAKDFDSSIHSRALNGNLDVRLPYFVYITMDDERQRILKYELWVTVTNGVSRVETQNNGVELKNFKPK